MLNIFQGFFFLVGGGGCSSFETSLFSSQGTCGDQKTIAGLGSLSPPYGSQGWSQVTGVCGEHHCLQSYISGPGNDVFKVKCLPVKKMRKKITSTEALSQEVY